LNYYYDPVGNVLRIEDAALPVRYFANQRIDPVSDYVYDSLDQLIKAGGWEAGGANRGPGFSRFDDPQACARYTQTYRYDRGANLLELTHEGPQNHSHRLLAAIHSNRCLPVLNGVEPDDEDFRNGFDANGNLLELQPGQSLRWDSRNQLCEVRPVERNQAANDSERYVYGADGERLRKVRQMQTNARTLISEVRYLPNLQIRTHSGTGEMLQVIEVQAGRSSVQVLHWESEPPKGIDNDQPRYSLGDLLGSCTLELDATGQVISHERYHPFGTSAWFAGRGEVEASYKIRRYSGKERDATGLYYYGFRYYVTGWQRWLNPDPQGNVNGLNLYCMVRNNPLTYFDVDGRIREEINSHNPSLELTEYSPAPLSAMATAENTSRTQFVFEEMHPTYPELSNETTAVAQLIKGLQLVPEQTTDPVISIAADINGLPPIAGGGEGMVYESRDGKYVYKKFSGFDRENSIPGSIEYEAAGFNTYYGAGSAEALLEDNQVYLKMIKLDGIPLDKLDKKNIPEGVGPALRKMFEEMESKDLYHQDPQEQNFLYSERDQKVYPVDMAAHPWEIAIYTNDGYTRRKEELFHTFSIRSKK